MNQLCKVCGEPAAGYHFGAFTCEGCKSFFGRTYNNLSALGECKNNGECVINKKNRTSCKSCRLKKCLVVGMSKSGSRYGRRSNWFKIHCLIQDQQEMNNRIAEANKNGDELGGKLSDPKDFLAKFNSDSGDMRGNGPTSLAELSHHRMSPRLHSPNSSEGSLGRSVSSPYSSLLEAGNNKMMPSAFTNPLLGATPPFGLNMNEFQLKEISNLASRFNQAAMPLPAALSPITQLSTINRLFLQSNNPVALFGKRLNDMQKLQSAAAAAAASEQLMASHFMPTLQAFNDVLKPNGGKDIDEPMNNGGSMQRATDVTNASINEQDGPIDLSVKRIQDFKPLTLIADTKCRKSVPGDHDSGFSPSSNEENHTSPLDLTSKRQCIGIHHLSAHHLNPRLAVDRDDNDDDDDDDQNVDIEQEDDDDDETSDVEVQDDDDDDRHRGAPIRPKTERQDSRREIECAP